MTFKRSLILLGLFGLVLGFVLLANPTPASSEDKATYKGSKACKACHADQYATWEKMKHSKALASLKPDQIANGKDDQGRACVQCHTTGYGQGGFTSEKDTPKFANVGCESCHGAGSKHVKLMLGLMMEEKEPTEDMEKHISKSVGCTQCHNPHISYKELYGGE